MSRSMLAEQSETSPYNHHLQEFLTFLKQERGFADATIVNRKRSLEPSCSKREMHEEQQKAIEKLFT